jgi:hypothetical protein
MNKMQFVFSVVLSLALFAFQPSALAGSAEADKARELIKEAAALFNQAAALADEKDPDKNLLKINSLVKQAGDKTDQARAIVLAGDLTDEQRQGLVVGYGDRDGDGKHDPAHPSNLAEQTQNPVASLISVPLESNFNFGVGPADNTQYVMNAKPVIPQNVSENWNWIHRGIQPVIVQDNLTNTGTDIKTDSSIFGMGDLTYQGFLTPAKPGKVIWGAGPVLVVPWGEDGLSTEKWQAGAGFVALTKINNWVIGSVVSQQWDVAGKGSADDVSLFVWQYFINHNFNDGWFATSSPTMTANWKADRDSDTWTIPVGGGFGKIFKINDHPFRASVQAFAYVNNPDAVDTDWTLQAEFRLLFPRGK